MESPTCSASGGISSVQLSLYQKDKDDGTPQQLRINVPRPWTPAYATVSY